MDEQILTAIVRDDETKTLLLAEPLDRTLCHLIFSSDPQGSLLQRPSSVFRSMLRGREVYALTLDFILPAVEMTVKKIVPSRWEINRCRALPTAAPPRPVPQHAISVTTLSF
jgi:hypothetical protein